MTAIAPRTIPKRLAPVLEALELEQPRVVTADGLAELARAQGLELNGVKVAYDLRRLGWLLSLRRKGAWEFVPGARAGPFGAGDRHIELRAALTVDAEFHGALATESAAVAQGLAARVPDREVLWLPPARRTPKSFNDWRVLRLPLPDKAIAVVDGLPTWRVEALLGGMARRPGQFLDWPNVGEWLSMAVANVNAQSVARSLEGAPRSAWQRASYLLAMGDAEAAAAEVIERAPRGSGPAYLGPRQQKDRSDRRFEINGLGAVAESQRRPAMRINRPPGRPSQPNRPRWVKTAHLSAAISPRRVDIELKFGPDRPIVERVRCRPPHPPSLGCTTLGEGVPRRSSTAPPAHPGRGWRRARGSRRAQRLFGRGQRAARGAHRRVPGLFHRREPL